MQRPELDRPKVASEVRAWLSVGVVLVIQFAGTVWWAASANAKLEALREAVTELKERRELGPIIGRIEDHEARIRAIEQKR